MENTEHPTEHTQNTAPHVDNQPNTIYSILNALKKQFTDYMLANHNIKFLDDETERRLYDILLGAGIAFITPYVYKYLMNTL